MSAADPGCRQAALTMLDKLLSNILQKPGEVRRVLCAPDHRCVLQAKYRTIWLSNAKVGQCLKSADGSVLLLEGAGFEPGKEPETLVANHALPCQRLRNGFQEYKDSGDRNNFLYRVVDAIKSDLYEIVGRPVAQGELGGQAQVQSSKFLLTSYVISCADGKVSQPSGSHR